MHAEALTPMHGRRMAAILGCVLAFIVIARLLTLGAYPILDPTEGRYAQVGKVMLETGNWITPQLEVHVPFLAKPPLSIWAIALSYATFGLNAFAARFPSFLAWGLTVWLVFSVAPVEAKSRDRTAALLATCVFASSSLAFYLGGGVMTDPALLAALTLTMVAFWLRMRGAGRLWGYLFFLGIAAALLAKGLIGVVLPALSVGVWAFWQHKWNEIWRKFPWASGTLLVVVLVLPWFVLAEQETSGFLRYFFLEEHFKRFLVPGWQGDLYGHSRLSPYGIIWVYAFIATLPWSVLWLGLPFSRRLRAIIIDRALIDDEWPSFLLCWHFAPLLFFTMASAVLITYVAASLPAFALLVAYVLQRLNLRSSLAAAAGAVFVPLAREVFSI